MINLEAIYTDVDDFCLLFIPQWEAHLIESGLKQRRRPSKLSEVMTIVISLDTVISKLLYKSCH
ncbi:hypothetical protein GCM10007931_22840 [Vibrio algivorus]|uniref:IS982 family transposase n=1 Tax=Vibrio algivorus TaxID=1667024 RepID=A0ABQ6EQQ3_9VIBR|nr:hypothetical protein GCM10007931_22840 [Vibrio algivorus]